jgi:hypothetical protein
VRFVIANLEDRPDLVEGMWSLAEELPEFLVHDDVQLRLYGNVVQFFPQFQLASSRGERKRLSELL